MLKISAQAVKDLGIQKLDGRDARVLRSADEKEPVKTVWVEPKTGKPVQIELSWPSRKASFTYASIRIDEVLDETLFELDVPPGYAMIDGDAKPKKYIDEINGKMLSKARNLVMACYKYADKKGDFPADIRDLKGVVMQEAALTALLADPGRARGPARAAVPAAQEGNGFRQGDRRVRSPGTPPARTGRRRVLGRARTDPDGGGVREADEVNVDVTDCRGPCSTQTSGVAACGRSPGGMRRARPASFRASAAR